MRPRWKRTLRVLALAVLALPIGTLVVENAFLNFALPALINTSPAKLKITWSWALTITSPSRLRLPSCWSG